MGPGPPGFHSDTLCPDVISIDGVQLGQAVLAQGLFTVYPKLKPFTKRCVCVSLHVCVTSQLSLSDSVSILHSDRGNSE